MPVMSGFSTLAGLPWERIIDKIERRILAGKQGMIVWWKMNAGALISIRTSRSFGCSRAGWIFA
jgi:hypothetical protein